MKQQQITKSKLSTSIALVNNRYKNGLNDDDQVFKMVNIANNLKGWHFIPKFDSYELCTDLEALNYLIEKYGYWSAEVKKFNSVLTQKGGHDYMTELNLKAKK